LTLASPLGSLPAMRGGFRTGAAVRAAQARRTGLLLETLALRHQLGVLARSNRRFRLTDRLLWLSLRWFWPRWREALVLIQPATVDRWHREGLRRCWRRRSRRPGRPRIDSTCRDLIRRMAAENCRWGAPRIHELLKLGITVSERTVSRYLRDHPTIRSQTWRTFLTNHLGQFTFILPEASPHASSADDFIGPTCRPTVLSRAVLGVPHERAVVDGGASLHRTSPGKHIVQHHVRDRTAIQHRGGRGPPAQRGLRQTRCMPGESIGAPASDLCDERRIERVVAGQGSPSLSPSPEDKRLGKGASPACSF
jgi:Homeodomain-like domain